MWEIFGEIFNWVLRASLYSVVVVFIIVLTQKLTRRVLSARWRYALWLVLLARLALPAGMETSWSLWNLATPEYWANRTLPDSGGQDAAAGVTIPMARMAMPDVVVGGHGESIRSTALCFASRACPP